jgi:peptidoglycan/xylan/chitin deacetylase (PgdA/CDA1 family)
MKSSLILLFIFLTTSLFAQQKMVAITVDDLPFVRIGSMTNRVLTGRTINLLKALENQHAPATGFVNLSKAYKDGELDSTRFNLLA